MEKVPSPKHRGHFCGLSIVQRAPGSAGLLSPVTVWKETVTPGVNGLGQ